MGPNLLIVVLSLLLPLCYGVIPVLNSFDFDARFGTVTLRFTDLVSARTFNISKTHLQSERNRTNTSLTLEFDSAYEDASYFEALGNVTEMAYHISETAYAKMMVIAGLGDSKSNTYMALDEEAILSPWHEPSVAISKYNATQVTNYVVDTVRPYVLDWNVNFNTGVLNMSFNEPMDPLTLDTFGLAFQSVSNAWIGGLYLRLSNPGSGTVIQTYDYQRKIEIQLSLTDVNLVKQTTGLCTSLASCYMSAWRPFINDTAGNGISNTGFDIFVSKLATSYVADSTRPTLVSWTLDLNSGSIILQLSEVIDIQSFNFTAVRIQTAATIVDGVTQVLTVNVPDNVATQFLPETPNTDLVVIQLNTDQINLLNSIYAFQLGVNYAYIVIQQGAFSDVAEIGNVFAGTGSTGIQAVSVEPDITPPSLSSFALNMTSKMLTLTMSKIINASLVQLNQMTLQSARSVSGSSVAMVLSTARATLLPVGDTSRVLEVQLTESGFSRMKELVVLGNSFATTWIAMTTLFVVDRSISKNRVEPITAANALGVTTYYPDYVPPRLLSWSIDMGKDLMNFTFSEPVDVATFKVTDVNLKTDLNTVDSTILVKLQATSYIAGSSAGNVYVRLSLDDVNSLKKQPPLCIAQESCYLEYSSLLVKDVASYNSTNGLVQNSLNASDPSLALYFVNDTVSPSLLQYELDTNVGRLDLYFDEPVRNTLMHSDKIKMYGGIGSSILYEFSNHSFSDGSADRVVSVTMSRLDFIGLKSTNGLGTQISNSYLYLGDHAFVDMNYNGVAESVTVNGLYMAPTKLQSDISPPALVAVELNSTNALFLHFDDAVDPITITSTDIVVQSADNFNINLFTARRISQEYTGSVLYDIVEPLLSSALASGILNSQDNTNVYINREGALTDVALIVNERMVATNAIREGNAVRTFRLDMNARKIILEMAFAIENPTISPGEFIVHTAGFAFEYTLTGYSNVEVSDNGLFITITLAHADYIGLLQEVPIELSSLVFLEVGKQGIVDARGHNLGKTSDVNCVAFKADLAKPEIDTYSLDLNTQELSITFNKPVRIASFFIERVRIVASRNSASPGVQLNQSTFITEVVGRQWAMTARFNLNAGTYPTDLDKIYLTKAVGVSIASTFLVISKGFVSDTVLPPNFLTEIPLASALAAGTYLADTTAPSITAFDFDMSLRQIKLSFDGGVNRTTCVPSYFQLLADPTDISSASYTLTTSKAIIASSNELDTTGTSVTIQLSAHDMNQIMLLAPLLCMNRDITWIATIAAGAIYDLAPSRNAMARVLFRFAIQVNTFTPDRVKPNLVQYNISLATGAMSLLFDEVMDCALTRVDYVTFQYQAFVGTGSEQFMLNNASSATVCPIRYTLTIDILIGAQDILRIQSYSLLMKSNSSTFLRPLTGSFFDAFVNSVVEIVDGRALPVKTLVTDTVQPILMSFTVTSQRILVLTFNEPVNVQSLLISGLTFQNHLSAPTLSFPLSQAAFQTATQLNMVVFISLLADYNTIVGASSIFVEQSKTYLIATNATIKDTSGNVLTPVLSSYGLALGPAIISFTLNMNEGTLTLVYSEAVFTNFSSVGISIQGNRTTNETVLALTTVTNYTKLTGADDTANSYRVKLSSTDVNNLKYNTRLATSLATTYLTVTFGLTYSLSVATIIPYLKTVSIPSIASLPCSVFVADATPPLCNSFTLDLNTGHLLLHFDEPVDLNSLTVQSITVVASSTGGVVAMTGLTTKTLTNVTTMDLKITTDDLNSLKLTNVLGQMDRLLLLPNMIADLAGNWFQGNSQLDPVVIETYIPDTTAPLLSFIELDLYDNALYLTFDEVVNVDTLKPGNIMILAAPNSPINVTLSNYSLIQGTSGSTVVVDMNTYRNDAMALRSKDGLATSVANTYIAISGVTDVAGNVMVDSVAFQIDSYVGDTHNAVLMSFDIIDDGSSGYLLTMYFDKFLNIDSFDCADLILRSSYNASEPGVVTLQLGTGDCTPYNPNSLNNSQVVSMTIPQSVIASTLITAPGSTAVNTFLFVVDSPVSIDRTGITIAPTAGRTGNIATYTAEGPLLSSYVLDLYSGKVTLVFPQEINRTSFLPWKIGFHSLTSNTFFYLTENATKLDGFLTTSPELDSIGVITLAKADRVKLQAIDVLGSTVYLIAKMGMVTSPNGFLSTKLTKVDARLPSRFIADTLAPVLETVQIDMGTEELELIFSEPIRVSTIKTTNIQLHNASIMYSSQRRKLTGGTVTMVGTVMKIKLLRADSAAMKLLSLMAKSQNSTYISFDFGTMFDMAGNPLLPISSTSARKVDIFIADVVSPVLESFALNMDTGLLTLFFSEPVNVTTMFTTDMQLQNRFTSRPQARYLLQGTTITSPSASVVYTMLSDLDIFNLKNIDELTRNRPTTYLVISSAFVKDLNANPVIAIPDGDALPCTTFTADLHAPYVTSFFINYDDFDIAITFNELVMLFTTDVRGLTLQEYSAPPPFGGAYNKFTLTLLSAEQHVGVLKFNTTVTVHLSVSDMNTIKYLNPLATEVNRTFMSLSSVFVADTFNNLVTPIDITSALRAAYVDPDSVQPEMSSYILDMNAGKIYFSFTETVNPNSFDDTQITLQTTATKRFGRALNLKNSRPIFGTMSRAGEMELIFDTEVFNTIKYHRIATTSRESYLSYTDRMIADYAGNFLPPLWDASVRGFSPELPGTYVTDTTDPVMHRWYVDRDKYLMHMLFDEPVDIVNMTNFLFSTSTVLGAGVKHMRFEPLTISYIKLNMEAIIEIAPYCTEYMTVNNTVLDVNGNATIVQTVECATLTPFPEFFQTLPSLYLSFSGVPAEDRAAVPNPLVKISYEFALKGTEPDCSLCPSNQYVSKRCTLSSDRECAACSVPAPGYWAQVPCAAEMDTRTRVCNDCPEGTYIYAPCTPTSDAVCRSCTVCTNMEYESQKCALGLNRICNTCKSCIITDPEAKAACYRGLYYWWYLENCCEDSLGRTVTCLSKTKEDMKITAGNSRIDLD